MREKEGEKEPTFRRSGFMGLRSKIRMFNEGYAPRARDSSYFGLFPP